MEYTVDVTGYITSANLVSPLTSFFEQPKYKVCIEPSPDVLLELEQRIEYIKRMKEDPYTKVNNYSHKDVCLEGCTLMFETLHKPRIAGSLKGLSYNDEFVGKYVNILGNIQIHPNGNAYLSVHMINEVKHEIDDDDFASIVSDDDDW